MTTSRPLSLILLLGVLCGCGNPGSPLPPSLMLPQRVADLTASRTGDAVTLHWTMPTRTMDRLVLKRDQRVVLCRAVQAMPCEETGELLLYPGTAAQWTDSLPPDLSQGPPRLLRYEVRLENHARQDAGPSNPAFAAAGWAPPAMSGAEAVATTGGIAISWQAAAPQLAGERLLVRLERYRVLARNESAAPAKGETRAGVPQPMEQTLEEPAAEQHTGWKPVIDADASLNRTYRYGVQLVEQVTLDGHALEVSGARAQTPVIDARDVFPPGVPADLAAVANADAGTIDLSWAPDTDADLAGYFVYRRVEGSVGPATRVSGVAPVQAAAWNDKDVPRGVHYAYSVSAVDSSGNESASSREAVEALPQ